MVMERPAKKTAHPLKPILFDLSGRMNEDPKQEATE
jgi:hypothetical protein